jgi:5-methylthioadenosine/S-adenosylhomocysteine deaminase
VSSDNLNMFDALRLAGLLHTSNQVDYRAWPSAREVLRMGTRESARACGLGDEVGSLEAGKRADLVLLTRDSYALAVDNDLPAQLVHSENGASVRHVLVDGQVVVRDGKLLTIDEEALFREVATIGASLDQTLAAEAAHLAELEAPIRDTYFRAMAPSVDGIRPSSEFH